MEITCDLQLEVVSPGKSGLFQSRIYSLRWVAKVGPPINKTVYQSDDFNINQVSYIDVDAVRPDDFPEIDGAYQKMIKNLKNRGWQEKSQRNGWVSQMQWTVAEEDWA